MSDSRDASLSGVSGKDASVDASPEGRGTGSSLAEAVVAALANVSTPPPAGATGDGVDTARTLPGLTAADASDPASGANAGDRPATPTGGDAGAVDTAPTLVDTSAVSVVASAAVAISDPPSRGAREDDATEPSPTQVPTTSTEGSTVVSSAEGEPTVRLGGAVVQHLTPESAKDAPEGIVVQYYGRTDVGLVREHNEDNFLVADLSQERRGLGETPAILKTTLGDRGLVLAVCDGMGGAAAGEVASQMAVDTIHEIMQAGSPPKDRDQLARRLVRAVEEAGARIFAAAKMDRTRRGMGTTATVAAMMDGTLFVGQVGDSRAYVLRGDQFALVTKDQSLVNQLIEAGQLTEEEAEAFEHSNIILQALGTTEEVTVDLTFLELRRGDRLLMCSDGLSGLVHGDMMREVLKSSRDLSEAAQQLIAMANAGGGHDNITVICAEFDGSTLRPPSSEVRVAYQQYPLPPEDPADAEPLPPRPTSMKSGGPKPGADVKLEGVRDSSRTHEGMGGGRWWALGLVLLFVLICVAAFIVLMDNGEQRGDAEVPSHGAVTIERAAVPALPSAAPTVARGEVIVSTVEDGQLYVDGEPRPGLPSQTLTLAPGPHRIEIRRGDQLVAERALDVAAGGRETVELTMPSGSAGERDIALGPGEDHNAAVQAGAVRAETVQPGAVRPVAVQPGAVQGATATSTEVRTISVRAVQAAPRTAQAQPGDIR